MRIKSKREYVDLVKRIQVYETFKVRLKTSFDVEFPKGDKYRQKVGRYLPYLVVTLKHLLGLDKYKGLHE